jgi:putative transposase
MLRWPRAVRSGLRCRSPPGRDVDQHRDRAQGDCAGKLLGPEHRRAAVRHLQRVLGVSERFACRVTGQHRATQRHKTIAASPQDPDAALREWLRTYAKDHPRRGFRPAYHDARADGWVVNHKKIQRLWREEGLRVPQRRRRKRHGSSTAPPAVVADAPNRVWAVDFQFDVTTDGRPIKIVSIIDEHTRECLGGMVERSITGEHLIGELDRVAAARGTFATVLTLRQRTRISLWRNGRLGSQSVWPSFHPARPTVAQRLC